ncbi:MAG: 4Fe-4S binding protein [Hyphomicrobiaceae bacterium]
MSSIGASAGGLSSQAAEVVPPSGDMAAAMLGQSEPVTIQRLAGPVPGWSVSRNGATAGWIGSTWELSQTVGYSGRPIDVLFAVTPDAHIGGARVVTQSEPVLTLGISDQDIAAFVENFRGIDLAALGRADQQGNIPTTISRATVSSGVIRDGILRSARALALGQGLLSAGGIDRVRFQPMTWSELVASGALAHARLGMDEASKLFAKATVPVEPGAGAFLDLYTGLIDPPSVGRSLLGQQDYSQLMGSLATDQTILVIATSGLHSHRGTDWRQKGTFERVVLVQGAVKYVPKAVDFSLLKTFAAADAPAFKEISLFRLPAEIDPMQPFTVEISAARADASGAPLSATIAAAYTLPAQFRATSAKPKPLWQESWQAKKVQVGVVLTLLAGLTLILFAQEWITRRPMLWRRIRLGYLGASFLLLGVLLNGQLSVVQVMAFIHALLTGFRWETFLIEPVIFILWGFVALGMLFWGRGVYCGWLCPFGALQELLNAAAQKFGVRQIEVPQPVHERLWVIKYTAFVGIIALSFYSMHDALVAAEVEPFKTAFSLRMMRAWPFEVFVLALLGAGLFIERFYCRYVCPLGAGIAIPAKLKIFDWLKRRPQCGRECRMCETKCTVGAIDALGRINPNECVLCLRCQVIMNDDAQCPVLKRRARLGGTSP